jgi:hypothetical protein
VLANVSESDRSDELLISTEGQGALFSVIGKHLNGANKPKTIPVKQTWDRHNQKPYYLTFNIKKGKLEGEGVMKKSLFTLS